MPEDSAAASQFEHDSSHYSSLFCSYPLLISHSSDHFSPFPSVSSSLIGDSSSAFLDSSSSANGVDLGPLKLATAIKQLDPSKRICQYEVPGGGVCKDASCDDIHLNTLFVSPS